jgi:hypothetical protein
MNVSCYQSPSNPSLFCAEVITRHSFTAEAFVISIPYGFEFLKSSDTREISIPFIPGNTCIRFLFKRSDYISVKDQITPYLSYQFNEKIVYEPSYENEDEDEDEQIFKPKPYQHILTQHYFTLGVNTCISPIVDETLATY